MELSVSIQSLSSAVAFAFIYVFITACRCSDIRISVGLSHNVSHPGDNVTLTCRVQGAQKETAVVWEKLPVNGAADVERELIGRDDQLSEDYRKLTKYDIYVIELPHVVISILTIHNVGVEESGLIGCSVAIDDDIYEDKILFQVFKQPSDISCSVDTEIFALEGDDLMIQCIIRKVQPLPHISVHLDHKNLTGHLTITNWTMNVHCGHQQHPVSGEGRSDAGHHCPVHFDYDVQFKLTDHVISYLDDGRELTVAVRHGQSGWPATVKRLTVNVRYAPKFNCSYPTTDVEFLSRNLVVVCRLLSNPALLTSPVVWWRHHRHHGNRTIHVGQNIDGYELREKITSVDDRDAGSLSSSVMHGKQGTVAYAVEFVIHQIMHDVDFQSVFHFYAENEVGSTTKTVHLVRQMTTMTTTRHQPSLRPRGHHTRRPSSSLVQPINEAATIKTIHPIIICAASCLLLAYTFSSLDYGSKLCDSVSSLRR